MRRSEWLALLLLGCAGGPDDSGSPQPEDCTDGVDNDLDGRTDCADSECTDVCDEVCGDGADNDGDGLVDCEDGECADSCTEVCDDGADNDGDALIDCQDDDCLGAPGCEAVLTRVLGGRMRLGVTTAIAYAGNDYDRYHYVQTRATATGVWGSARVQGADSSWDCTWTVDSVRVEHLRTTFQDYTYSGSPIVEEVATLQRTGFGSSGGCPDLTSARLPAQLLVAGHLGTGLSSYAVFYPLTGNQPVLEAHAEGLAPMRWYYGTASPNVSEVNSSPFTWSGSFRRTWDTELLPGQAYPTPP